MQFDITLDYLGGVQGGGPVKEVGCTGAVHGGLVVEFWC